MNPDHNPPVSRLIQIALRHHQQGELDTAAALYQHILSLEPDRADAWYLLGLVARQNAEDETAVEYFTRAIAIDGTDASYHAQLGAVLKNLGRLEEALAAYDAAIAIAPDQARVHHHRGMLLQQLGRGTEALAAFDTALSIEPELADAHFQRGTILFNHKQYQQALGAYDLALRHNADYPELHHCRGLALYNLGRPDEAIAACDLALARRPDFALACNTKGLALTQLGQSTEAVAAFDTAIALQPDFAAAYNNRGIALNNLGRIQEALDAFDHAIALQPGFPEAHSNRAIALNELKRTQDAFAAWDRALALKPDYAQAYLNRGNAHAGIGQRQQALDDYKAALRIDPSDAEAHLCLANTLNDIGHLEQAAAAYRDAITLNPRDARSHSNYLLSLHYSQPDADATIAPAARRFGAIFDRFDPHHQHNNPPNPDRRLRIGYVSGDFLRHPVGYFLESFLPYHRDTECEIVCFTTRPTRDELTNKLQALAQGWHSLVGLSDSEAANLIRAQGIDILIDLSGHTAYNRLPLFGLKPAPVQASWLGYVGTTGLRAMDYVLADRFVAPEQDQNLYTETIWHLPNSYMAIRPPARNIPISPRRTDAEPITFGSFNNSIKLSDTTIALWSHLLRRIPHARLLLKYSTLDDPLIREQLKQRFAEHGIPADRVLFEGKSPRKALLESYNRLDIALDPTPYGGGITTAEALWMGVPVITLSGHTWPGRHSESILNTIGMPELVAQSSEDYLEIASALAADAPRRAQVRTQLRPMVEQSPLCDGARFARDAEAALRGMWRGWATSQLVAGP